MSGIDVLGSFSDAARAYRAHAPKLLAMGAVFAAPMTGVALIAYRIADAAASRQLPTGSLIAAMAFVGIAAALGAMLLAGAVYDMMRRFRALETVDLGASLQHSLRRAPAQLGATLLAGMMAGAVFGAWIGVTVGLGAATESMGAGGAIILPLVWLPAIAAMIYFGTPLVFVAPAAVAGFGPIRAIKRAFTLAKNQRVPLIGAGILTGLIGGLPDDIIMFVGSLVFGATSMDQQTAIHLTLILATAIPAVFISPFIACFVGLLYDNAATWYDENVADSAYVGYGDVPSA